MNTSVYVVNKGINKSIEFKGLKAQYIWYVGGALIGLLIIFAVLYIIGINTYVCLAFILTAGSLTVMRIYRLSNEYGEHGMMKKLARRSVPDVVKNRSRSIFMNKKQSP